MITNEEILELVRFHFEEGGSCSEYYGTTKDFIDFARAMYEMGYEKGDEYGWELYLSDTHKIRNLNETDFAYSFQFWIDNGTQHELTGEWSDWEFLKLYDTRDEVETMIDDKNSSWFIIHQINDKFALIDLRKGKK